VIFHLGAYNLEQYLNYTHLTMYSIVCCKTVLKCCGVIKRRGVKSEVRYPGQRSNEIKKTYILTKNIF